MIQTIQTGRIYKSCFGTSAAFRSRRDATVRRHNKLVSQPKPVSARDRGCVACLVLPTTRSDSHRPHTGRSSPAYPGPPGGGRCPRRRRTPAHTPRPPLGRSPACRPAAGGGRCGRNSPARAARPPAGRPWPGRTKSSARRADARHGVAPPPRGPTGRSGGRWWATSPKNSSGLWAVATAAPSVRVNHTPAQTPCRRLWRDHTLLKLR